jgi:phospholipid/cholesterol/gamma-HCH transport system substrate-binding protein
MSKSFRLGLFVVGALIVATCGVFLIGGQQMMFHRTILLYAQFQNVAGLGDGAEVRVGGIHQGTVKAIALPTSPEGKVTVELHVNSSARAVITNDSVASIQAEGLVGDKYVNISFGSKTGADVKEGDTIKAEQPLEAAQLIKRASQILDEAQGAVQDLHSISSKINQGTGTAGALLNDKSLYTKVDSTVGALNEDAEALKHNFLLRGFFKNRGYENPEELTKNEIRQLPQGPHSKQFDFESKQLFDKPDSAKLKNEKALNEPDKFLQANGFGLAVVEAHASMKGDSAKDRETTQAQAMVVRDYLVKNFKLEDTRIKTMGTGKANDPSAENGVSIIVYPQK